MPITGKTQVVGVIGDPVAQSLSPPMHGAAFHALDLDWVYVPFHVRSEHLEQAVAGIKALGMRGVNVTVPHKVRIMDYLDEIDDEARVIGAVNTVVHEDGRLIGYNTDGRGFVRSLQIDAGWDVTGQTVLLLGAGGAALAIATALAIAGAGRIDVANRTVTKAERVTQTLGKLNVKGGAFTLHHQDEAFVQAARRADIVVQCTTVGMFPHHDVPPIVPPSLFKSEALVADIVYNPLETSFLREARQHGCRVLSGDGMLAYQGAIAFELWTGRPAPDTIMLSTLKNHLLGMMS